MTAESGTGVVHQAPGFGEDDFRVCMGYGIFNKGDTVVCPVNSSGQFTADVTDFSGQYVKVRVIKYYYNCVYPNGYPLGCRQSNC